MTQFVRIDRSKRLRDQPETGHNRWHPDIPPIIEVGGNENIVVETRDASDGQIGPHTTVADFESMDQKVSHPLTGPIYVNGAEPGDLLEVEYVDIFPQPYGFTRFRPGAGFLRDLFPEPFLAHWDIEHGYATSEEVPGVRIPDGSFMGTAGLAPSHQQLQAWTEREQESPRPGRSGPATGYRRRRARRPNRQGRAADRPATRECGQHGHQAVDAWIEAVHSGCGRRRALLGGRRPLRSRGRGGLHNGD